MKPLKFKRDGQDYVATLPNGDRYKVGKTQRILLGRFGGGTVYTFWKADFFHADAPIYSPTASLLIGTKYGPDHFTCKTGDTKKLAVIACQAHADGAGNEADPDDRR